MQLNAAQNTILAKMPFNQVLVSRKVDETPYEQSAEDQYLADLKARDQEVRTHEASHAAAAGPHLVRGPSYQYTIGPDGKPYATGGEVQVDVSPVRGNPRATLLKAQQIRSAATAVAAPSSADLAAASVAAYMETNAMASMNQAQSNLNVFA